MMDGIRREEIQNEEQLWLDSFLGINENMTLLLKRNDIHLFSHFQAKVDHQGNWEVKSDKQKCFGHRVLELVEFKLYNDHEGQWFIKVWKYWAVVWGGAGNFCHTQQVEKEADGVEELTDSLNL